MIIYNGEDYTYCFYLAQEADGRTPITGVAGTTTIEASISGGAFSAVPGAAVQEIGDGWYSKVFPTSGFLAGETGEILIKADAGATTRTWRDKGTIVPWNPYSSTDLGVVALTNLVSALSSGMPLSSAAVADIWAAEVENDELGADYFTAAQLLRGIFAHSTGPATRSAGGSGNILEYTSPDGGVIRIAHDVTAEGERMGVTYNLAL